MSMSKHHFEAIAQAINTAAHSWRYDRLVMRAIKDVAENIADTCQQENPKFNRERFLKACGF